MISFIEECLSGVTKPENIDDYVEKWHNGNTGITLQEYLGMTLSEFRRWIINDEEIYKIIEERKCQKQ